MKIALGRRRFSTAAILIVLLSAAGCVRPASAPPTSAASLQPSGSLPANTLPAGPPSTSPSASPTSLPPTASPLPPTSAPLAAAPASPSPTTPPPTPVYPAEMPVTLIPLAGPLSSPDAEISGLAWYNDALVFLPQYPERFGESGSLFTLSKSEILAFLAGQEQSPLEPRPIPFDTGGIAETIAGYEGFESITFSGDTFFATIEAHPDGMLAYLVAGRVLPGLSGLRLDPGVRTPIRPQADILNFSDESIILFGDMLLTLYEANGAAVNPQPQAHLFDSGLTLRNQLAFPSIEYRLTDATPADENGRFWAINTFYVGDASLYPRSDPIAEMFGEGETHAASPVVERLLQFQFTEQGIALVNAPPIQLELAADGATRNWEGIARLDQRGFLLATDEHPATLFAFVPVNP